MSSFSSSDCSELRNGSPNTRLRVLRRRVVAGLGVESSVECCGNDVGDVFVVELEELVDNPGTPIGTQFSVLHYVFFSFLKTDVVFDHWFHA